jgi:hypothetical protein
MRSLHFICILLLTNLIVSCVPGPISEPTMIVTETAERITKDDIVIVGTPVADPRCIPGELISEKPEGTFVDIVDVQTQLDGEVLTTIMHVADIPDSIQRDFGDNVDEEIWYDWKVEIDTDNKSYTGLNGYEYQYGIYMLTGNDPYEIPFIDAISDTDYSGVYSRTRDGELALIDTVDYDIDTKKNTILLRGEIPGITEHAKLRFQTHNGFRIFFYNDSVCGPDSMASSTESECVPGNIYEDAEESAVVDIVAVQSYLQNDNLIATFFVRELPEEISINMDGSILNKNEYQWYVDIDNDFNENAQDNKSDYRLLMANVAKGEEVTGSIEKLFSDSVSVCRIIDDRQCKPISEGQLLVSYEENSISLIGEIPQISENSRLTFVTYDMNINFLLHDSICKWDG